MTKRIPSFGREFYENSAPKGAKREPLEMSAGKDKNLLAFSPMLRYHKNSYLRMSSLSERICGSGMTCPPEEGT